MLLSDYLFCTLSICELLIIFGTHRSKCRVIKKLTRISSSSQASSSSKLCLMHRRASVFSTSPSSLIGTINNQQTSCTISCNR